MKLEKIKLSGFKSFVDTTTIPISGNLTAIVGPNGCGKSNIIDAVRWVMGESSAKHLRGGNMADVIFNGSSGRKPVSTASVELIFNNTEGKLGGEYAQYDTIAIKRQVSRDGQSLFMLNGSRCRRKDVTDLFLGTGLGSRSYAIIEQGTISRMVEAKPDELRVHIEEAAGVSKYKERRGEAEVRMQHTRENLERLDDLREEVDRQLKSLQKQAEKAEKYTELKKQERLFKLELLAMRWHSYQQAAQALEMQLHDVAAEHNRLFVELRGLDSDIETKRTMYKSHQQTLNALQGDYYAIAAEVSSLEQAIKHNESNHEETLLEIQHTQQQIEQINSELTADEQALLNFKQDLAEAEESLIFAEEKHEELLQTQQTIQQQRLSWQQQWDTYRTESAKYKEQAEVQRVKTAQLENQNRQLQIRLEKLQNERSELSTGILHREIEVLESDLEYLTEQRAERHEQLTVLHQQIQDQRLQLKQHHETLHRYRSELHGVEGKITSLELLQQHAMGKDNKNLGAWLTTMELNNKPRLAEFLEVESGWETAVETVLSSYLEAICVDRIEPLISGLIDLKDEAIVLFANSTVIAHNSSTQMPCLTDKVTAPWHLNNLLAGIYCANDQQTAFTIAEQLNGYESVITPDGTWFGPGWLKIVRTKDSKSGVLQREKELRQLKQRQQELQQMLADLEDQVDTTETHLKTIENQRETWQHQHNSLSAELSSKNADFSAKSAKLEQQQRRLKQVCQELDDINDEQAENSEIIAESRLLQDEAEHICAEQEQQKQQLDTLNLKIQSETQQIDTTINESRQQVYSLKAKIDTVRSSENATSKQITRLQNQRQQALERIITLEHKLQQTLEPLVDEKHQLEQQRVQKNELEARLKQQRQQHEEIESVITQLSEQQARVQRALTQEKENLDQLRFDLQESKVRQQTVNEQLKETDADVETLLKNLPADATEIRWKNKVDELTTQIERLGTINLAAIEEYRSQAERMNFLNEQHRDLTEALDTLAQAINKIDKESRMRFKETFDKINSNLQEKFPKLFGGGQAYLELTDQDLLETGVNIIARPPGKRNSSIHLLSGGEKALTAVALVFSIFELNPAPFCLLDEVDAPLDDANVGRFSKMVEEMSETVQFLYISHNKVTMEIAKQLAGVTMKEPGVSRMVAVDIEEAVSLAEI